MKSLEIGPCDPTEYIHEQNSRVPESELSAEFFYTFMALSEDGTQAHKAPAQINKSYPHENLDMYYVGFTFLDPQLAPKRIVLGLFSEGFYSMQLDRGPRLTLGPPGELTARVASGYFKDPVSIEKADIEGYAGKGIEELASYLGQVSGSTGTRI